MRVATFFAPAAFFLSALALLSMADAQKHLGETSPVEERPHHLGGEGGKRNPAVGGATGGTKDITGSNDEHLREVSEFTMAYFESENSDLHYVQYKAEVQVVAGLIYTLKYKGNDSSGACKEERTIVIYDKPWLKERTIKSDTKEPCS